MTAPAIKPDRTPLEIVLDNCDEESWAATLTTLMRSIHEVDKIATEIWFAFYPLALFRALRDSPDADLLAQRLLLQGHYYLAEQIDSSHTFLYGHRYWPQVKRAIEEHAEKFVEPGSSLADQILSVARRAAQAAKVEESLVVGITAVGFMTLTQIGVEAFKAASGEMLIRSKQGKRSPAEVLRERAKNDSQGMFGFLRTVNKRWTVTYDENDASASYTLNNMQDLAWGAADDRTRNWREIDPRRIEGPIPVECRSASCGTCWVGILGGADRLSQVAPREEKKIKEFGYIDTSQAQPAIRLACQAQALGAVSIVIPPWNGVFGRYLRAQKGTSGESSASSET